MHEDARREIGRFYQPETVALIGVSSSFGFGHGLPRFLSDHGWDGRVYPVNPNVEEIAGLRAYPSLRDVPAEIDLACIMVPARFVEEVLQECVTKGVKAGEMIVVEGLQKAIPGQKVTPKEQPLSQEKPEGQKQPDSQEKPVSQEKKGG